MSTFPDRSKSLLSGEEIINFKQNSLKDVPAGNKDYAPDNSWLEQKQIQATLETHHSLVGAQRIEKKSNLSSAEWLSEVGKAKVKKKAGKHWEVFGHTVNSEDWLLPEEALFLLETNSLELYLEDVPLSVEQSYALIVGDFISLEEYRVYSHLSRKGYRVMRHDKEISVTPYEKDIHADQVNLAAKRSVPGSKEKSRSVSRGECISGVSGKVSDDLPSRVNVGTVEDVCLNADVGTAASAESAENGVGTAASTSQNDGIDMISPVISNIAAGTGALVHPVGAAAAPSEETPKTKASANSKDPCNAAPSAAAASAHSMDGIGTVASVCPENGIGCIASVSSLDSVGTTAGASSSCAAATGASIQPEGPLGTAVIVSSDEITVLENTSATTAAPETSLSNGAEPSHSLETNSFTSDSESSQNRTVPSAEAQNMLTKGNSLVAKVRELISLDSEGSEDVMFVSNDVETPDKGEESKGEVSMNIDDSSSEDAFPPSPSPELMVVEADGQVIEIGDDSSIEEDDPDVIFTGVKKTTVLDTVNLLDSDEDDDVVIIYHKPTNIDPSKWRKRFLTATEFVNFKFSEKPEECTKMSKVKLIDLFDLGRKTFDSIWKAIPRHDGDEEFINAPDQRFIPSTILPKFAQYRITLQQRDVSPIPESRTPVNVDTSRELSQIVQYGQEPPYFTRNESYSFHRSRGVWNAPGFNQYATRPPRNQMFSENRQNGRFNNYQGQGLQYPQNDRNHQPGNNQNPYVNRNQFGNQNFNFGNFFNQNRPRNFQPAGNFAPPFGNPPNQLGGLQNEGLKLAVMQAYQLQMLAVGLMQSCQTIMQQVPGLTNTNMFPVNDFGNNPMGIFIRSQPFRGHRPYRRPWRGQGRRRYYNDDRSVGPRVTEIPIAPNRERADVVLIGSDDEDKKVKPGVKRNVALNAIASLNAPKRKKLKISTDVKSTKLDLDRPGPSTSVIDLDEACSVKSESPCPSPKRDLGKCAEKQDVSPLARADPVTPARNTVHVAEPVQRLLNFPEESMDSQPAVDSDNSRPSYMVYDEQVTVDSDSALSGKSLDASGPKGPGQAEPMEVTDSDAVAAPAVEADYQPTPLGNTGLPGSWKSYKERAHPLDEQPSCSKALVSIDNERSDIKDVMKSLRVIGPLEDAEVLREEFRVSYDVYLPNQPFRKSVRLLPNYRIIIAKSDCFPTVLELNHLEATYRDNVPFLYAVVTLDAIRLYNLRLVCLPSLVTDV